MAHRKSGRGSSRNEEATGAVPTASRLVVLVSCIAAVSAMFHGLKDARSPVEMIPTIVPSSTISVTLPSDARPSAAGSPIPSTTPAADLPQPNVTRIGIVAGHWGNDTGAVCPDGLTESEVNLDVAQRVVARLQDLGYQADLLEEFDAHLEGYRSAALVSIHADSCEAFPNATPPASGFKVASVEDSLVPDAEARLVACLTQCYAARTGMFFHANSITYDMIYYHSFYEIDGQTPGAIIETGFMLNDRSMLTQRTDLVAQGIVDGIVCFIEGDRP